MISPEDRLRIYAAVQAECGNFNLAEVVCTVAKTVGVEKALLEFNLTLAHPRLQDDQPKGLGRTPT
jgi:hypothetical protein